MRVTKTFTFHAAHRDEQAVDQCARLHGHTYRLELIVEGTLHPDGPGTMLIHGNELKAIYCERIEPVVEHQYLNETLVFNPTMELFARWCYTQLLEGMADRTGMTWDVSVRLWETPTMYTEVERSDA